MKRWMIAALCVLALAVAPLDAKRTHKEKPKSTKTHVKCCDGTLSPSCTSAHSGCCSHHGGVCAMPPPK